MSATLAHSKRTSVAHRREPSVPHEVKETLDAVVTETQDGDRCLNNYVLKDVIGHGAYGTVILAYDKGTKTKYVGSCCNSTEEFDYIVEGIQFQMRKLSIFICILNYLLT